ncbi:hypothetical protein G7046_g4075 [Stylonectria norvegica]|nr:hypothetical protein G7046_g4075 [Stylonectria norvegica]
MNNSPADLVPLRPKVKRRFYEPIVFTRALTVIARSNGSSHTPEPTETPPTEEERFRSFVNKLANICDNVKGGDSVTSFAVLEHDQGVTYVFGCNQLKPSGLRATTDFVERLLGKIAGVSELKPDARVRAERGILPLVLAFNRPRVERYIGGLQQYIGVCLDACPRLTDDEDLISCAACLAAIKAFFAPNSGITKFINDRARQGRMPGMKDYECWSDLRHYMSRLLAYEAIVAEFIRAEAEWPALFQDFHVTSIPSSDPEPNPLGRKSETAHNIIGRMTSDASEMERYRECAQGLQAFNLDDRISTECKSRFRPIVHSEVLVLDWVVANYKLPQYRFFEDFRYIGSSKPTCKLCSYYFAAHPSRTGARPTHGNLYISWRFPDVSTAGGKSALSRRQSMINSMMEKIREDAWKIMEDKGAVYKKHDSNTYEVMSARLTDGVGGDDTDVDDLEERFRGGFDLEGTPTRESLLLAVSDDDGGVSLF